MAEAKDLINLSASRKETFNVEPVKFGEGLTANTEPSLEIGRCRDLTAGT